MTNYEYRHHFRLDPATETALEQICRMTFMTKSAIMRRYVREGVARDVQVYADEAGKILNAARTLKSI